MCLRLGLDDVEVLLRPRLAIAAPRGLAPTVRCRRRPVEQAQGARTMANVLVLNTGSSSIKYRLLDLDAGAATVLASGVLERIGEATSRFTHQAGGGDPEVSDGRVADHRAGFGMVFEALAPSGARPDGLAGVGHRVVHGGDRFSAPALVDDQVVAAIREQVPLAPLHNPANLLGIEAARAAFPRTPQVAVFATAFHRTLPPRAWRYALPRDLAARLRIRRYGFHGTSHAHVARKAAELLGRPPEQVNLVTMHLGNGASVAAVAGGRCVDTSMGLTPLEGLVMGTRSGDLDPAVVLYLQREAGMGVDEIDALLNTESGLKGLAGVNDVREIQRRAAAGDGDALEALDVYCYRIRKYVGAYAAVLGRLDALVFTAGVGEHSDVVRAGVCGGLGQLGVRLDPARNRGGATGARLVSGDDSAVAVLVVPTDEELEIAEQTLATIRSGSAAPPV
jgi:acetate kinase